MALLEAHGIRHSFATDAGPVPVLDGLSLSVEPGEMIAIQGPSGSGKSTLLYVLGALLRPRAGRVLWNGQHVYAMPPEELARFRNRNVGFVFQQFHLLARANVLDNILLPSRYPAEFAARSPLLEERAREIAGRLSLEDRLRHLPNQLSGGQQQRVALARALLRDPALLLADEPTGNLDSKNAHQILDLFQALNEEGRSIIVITHDAEVAARCSRVIHLLDGRAVSEERRGDESTRAKPTLVAESSPPPARALPARAAACARSSLPEVLRGYRRNTGRTALNAAGIVIGIASVMAMVTLGQFVKRKILASYDFMGVNNLAVRGHRNWELRASDPISVHFRAFDLDRDLKPLPAIFPEVRRLTPVMDSWNDTVIYGGKSVTGVSVLGVAPEFLSMTNRGVRLGRGLTDSDGEGRSSVCVIGHEIAEQLFRNIHPIGQIAYVTGNNNKAYTCVVIGVLTSQSSNQEWYKPNLQVLTPFQFFPYVNTDWDARINDFVVQLREGADVERTAKTIQAFFERKYGKSGRFSVSSDTVLLAQMRRFLTAFSFLLGAIAMISLAVGGIGITNMMLVTLTERYREIGLRKALGATDFGMRLHFLLESSALCLIAGAAGLVLGFASYQGLIWVASRVTSQLKFEWVVDPWAIAISAVSMTAVGIASGLVPALRAERLQVIEALRSE